MIAWHHSGSYSLNEAVSQTNYRTLVLERYLLLDDSFRICFVIRQGRQGCMLWYDTCTSCIWGTWIGHARLNLKNWSKIVSFSALFGSYFLLLCFFIFLLINLSCAISDRELLFVDQSNIEVVKSEVQFHWLQLPELFRYEMTWHSLPPIL